MEKTKVLHVIYSLSSGGIESMVSTLYENIDREKVQFDFAVLSPVDPIHKNKLERLGANIYFLSDLGLHNSIQAKIRWRISALTNYNKLISSNTYDAVHCHMFNRYSLYILSAKLKGVKKRIVHSHTAGTLHENILTKYIRRARNIIGFEWLVTNKIACSIEAAYSGLTVLSSDIPGLEWAKRISTVYFFKNENVEELYLMMKSYLDNKGNNYKRIRETREIIEKDFSITNWSENIINIYNL